MRIFSRFQTLAAAILLVAAAARPARAEGPPPPIPREFRAAWVATVANIDWPSRPGLDAEAQRREAVAILDLARDARLNAVVLQVRTAADALYASPIEPWSAYLTGTQGKDPGYDPLAFWVEEAHRRGLLLHAWLNPFRARLGGAKYEEAAAHVGRARPDLVRQYGTSLWLDPGEPEARDLTLRVVADLARRYDLDGVHIDDYFYPYPIPDPDHPGRELPFPDDASWAKAQAAGTTLDRAAWRRSNVDQLVEGMYAAVRRERPRALVGVSPFGIIRPGIPAGVVGFDQYDKLAADAARWLREGWCDYLAPQLYWKVDAPGQPFRPLLQSWLAENPRKRHVWPGLSISRIGDGPKGYEPDEIVRQLDLIREVEAPAGSPGSILFSFKALQANKRGLTDRLRDGPFAAPAIVPPTPWLGAEAPARPKIAIDAESAREQAAKVKVEPGDQAAPFLWAVQVASPNGWRAYVLPGTERDINIVQGPQGLTVAVTAVDRLGNASEPAVVTGTASEAGR